ncbi:MAG: efflux RND transporter permease subunit [Bacteroides sp.]|nr:efflux RND transporter permease subunit [Bacteroides sp.]
MKIKLFIDRPILAGVISALILMVGIIGLSQLSIEQFPDIAPPTVEVKTTYTGANAETIQKSVVAPLEESINGVENMMYMVSSSANTGDVTITIYFKQGTDPDMAQVNVQNRVAAAQGLLPAEVTKVGVTTSKKQNSTLKIFGLYSPDNSYDDNFLNNYLKINIEPLISRIPGVGDANVMGADYSMRIWLKPEVMAQYKLIPSDITTVLGEQNIESPTGVLGENSDNTFQYTLKYRGRYETEEEFEQLVIKALPNGEVLKLKDVADIELGALSYTMNATITGHPGTACMISQQSGSNANEIISEIDKVLEQASQELPKGMKIVSLLSTKDFLDASIDKVVETLVIAIILVILVVFLFLQSFRSTVIPAVSIIVSLIGTFAFLNIVGFSLNLLTLFALVLVIGTVVDDAIVVVEAVQAKFDEGHRSPYVATVKAMGGISSALVTTSLVFMSVFIPVCFVGGTTGTFYSQFGATMAAAVGLSLVNSLTLCPALCALFMTPHADSETGTKLSFSSRFHRAFEASFSSLVGKYQAGVSFFLRRKWLAGGLLVLACGALAFLLMTTKTGLIPNEDRGNMFINVSTAPGSSMAETKRIMQQLEERICTLPQVEHYAKIAGYGMISGNGSSTGMFILKFKPWAERTEAQDQLQAIMGQIYARTADIKSARIMAFAPPMITGYGNTNGVEMYIQDKAGGSVEDLQAQTVGFIQALSQRPEIAVAFTSFDTRYPQYRVEVDAIQCKKHGVSPDAVLSTLSGYVGGSYSSNLNLFSKLYRVMVQAAPEYRLDTEALNNIFVRTTSGEMSPISQYLRLTKVYGAESLTRFNMFSAISVNITPANGFSSGQAIQAIREVASEVLPTGYGYEFSGMTRDEAGQGNSILVIFIICFLFVYLILCALYESLFIPLAVILSVPFGLMGSFLFAQMFGIENNIYMQVGLIMLIGLLAKTAILLTEYASERRRQGMSIRLAALDAARVRLRPILMTALAMVFGMLPLAVATGVGANGYRSLAIGTVGGILVGTIALLFIVPVLFMVFQRIQEKLMPAREMPEIED